MWFRVFTLHLALAFREVLPAVHLPAAAGQVHLPQNRPVRVVRCRVLHHRPAAQARAPVLRDSHHPHPAPRSAHRARAPADRVHRRAVAAHRHAVQAQALAADLCLLLPLRALAGHRRAVVHLVLADPAHPHPVAGRAAQAVRAQAATCRPKQQLSFNRA